MDFPECLKVFNFLVHFVKPFSCYLCMLHQVKPDCFESQCCCIEEVASKPFSSPAHAGDGQQFQAGAEAGPMLMDSEGSDCPGVLHDGVQLLYPLPRAHWRWPFRSGTCPRLCPRPRPRLFPWPRPTFFLDIKLLGPLPSPSSDDIPISDVKTKRRQPVPSARSRACDKASVSFDGSQ